MSTTFVVDVTFDVNARDYDPDRVARVTARFAQHLPPGSQTLDVHAAVSGTGHVTARVPETPDGIAHALHSVLLALELAASGEPSGLDSLGDIQAATVERRTD